MMRRRDFLGGGGYSVARVFFIPFPFVFPSVVPVARYSVVPVARWRGIPVARRLVASSPRRLGRSSIRRLGGVVFRFGLSTWQYASRLGASSASGRVVPSRRDVLSPRPLSLSDTTPPRGNPRQQGTRGPTDDLDASSRLVASDMRHRATYRRLAKSASPWYNSHIDRAVATRQAPTTPRREATPSQIGEKKWQKYELGN